MVAVLCSLTRPPEHSVREPDGSYTLELRDASTLKWTRRPDGTWRRPERRRAGWVGELERERYTIPKLRSGDELAFTEVAGWQ
mmetsp:Transcript_53692/g.143885  ORF Transcript_53692/g.143885 Transcript_53692/m.143885 type:complete len:83 (-) Transcript_53692:74-322(-)